MSASAGTGRLTRLALRLDRRTLASWAVAVGALAGVVGIAFNRLYPTTTSRVALVKLADGPVLRTILGPLLAPKSTGGLVAWRMGSVLVIVLGLATTFLVVRRTRAEEQHDRGALVISGPVGRASPVVAALADAAALDLAAAATIALALVALGQAPSSSILLGAIVGASAWWFGAVAALLAQVAATSKGANGAAAAVVAVAFLVRALGELYAGWLLWVSPLSWVAKAAPFGRVRPAVLLVALATGVLVGGAAAAIAQRREFGRGLLGERRHASRPLGSSPLALAWRLERVTIVTTIAAASCYSVAIGSVVGLFNRFLKSSPAFERGIEQLGGTHVLEDAFTKFMAVFGAIALGAWAVSMVLRLHTEEERGRVTVLVAGGAPRAAVFDGFSLTALGASVLGVLLFGVGLGVGRGLADHRAASLLRGASAGLVAAPAMLVLVAIAMLAVGASERAAPLAWAGVVWCAVVAVVGSFLGLPQLVLDLSPFTHVPSIPLRGDWWVPCAVLLALSALIATAGRAAFGRRAIGGA